MPAGEEDDDEGASASGSASADPPLPTAPPFALNPDGRSHDGTAARPAVPTALCSGDDAADPAAEVASASTSSPAAAPRAARMPRSLAATPSS